VFSKSGPKARSISKNEMPLREPEGIRLSFNKPFEVQRWSMHETTALRAFQNLMIQVYVRVMLDGEYDYIVVASHITRDGPDKFGRIGRGARNRTQLFVD
jgi:hypothetical protein